MLTHIISGIFAAPFANNATLTLDYPPATTVTRFVGTNGHKLVVNQIEYAFDTGKIRLAFNRVTLVLTNTSGKTFPAGATWTLQLAEREITSGAILARGAKGGTVEVAAPIAGERLSYGLGALAVQSLERKDYPLLGSDNYVTFEVGDTDAITETNLRAAYVAAKLLTPGGSALSATNRAFVLVPRGIHILTDELVLDTNYVDWIAEFPENPVQSGKVPLHTDYSVEAQGQPLQFFRPTGTVIQSNGDYSVFRQTVADVRLMGFTLAQLRQQVDDFPEVDYSALLLPINATGNASSHYQDMVFFAVALRWQNSDNTGDNVDSVKETGSVTSRGGVQGTWVDCVASGPAWRTRNQNATFTGKFLRCYGGTYSWSNMNPNGFQGAVFVDCHSRGSISDVPNLATSGGFAFGGTNDIDANCIFSGCTAGPSSFGSNFGGDGLRTVAGSFFNCKAGAFSFGGIYFDTTDPSIGGSSGTCAFKGIANKCVAGSYSFGGGNSHLSAAAATWTRSGTTATITSPSHGLSSSDQIAVSVSSSVAAITLGSKTVTVSDANTFTFTCLNAGATSGTIIYRPSALTDGAGSFTGTLIDCEMGPGSAGNTDNFVPLGTITGTIIGSRVTSGSWSDPTAAPGLNVGSYNADGTLFTKASGIALSVYGAGTKYSLTNTAAAIDFGTTDPTKVISAPGTYLVFGQIHLAYAGATVATETATLKVRRTNNTAADVSAAVVIDLPVSTTLTHSYGIVQIPPFTYTTTNSDDSLSLFANVSAALGAGTIDATAIGTSLVAIKIF